MESPFEGTGRIVPPLEDWAAMTAGGTVAGLADQLKARLHRPTSSFEADSGVLGSLRPAAAKGQKNFAAPKGVGNPRVLGQLNTSS
jgi:hypothetical protein